MKPIMRKLSLDYPEINFTSINTDDEDASWINEKYDITTIPRYYFFKNQDMVHEHEGAGPLHVFEYLIKSELYEQKQLNMLENGISTQNLTSILSSNNLTVILLHSDNPESINILPYYSFLMKEYENIYFITANAKDSEALLSTAKQNSKLDIKFPFFLLYEGATLVDSFHEVNQDVARFLIADALLDKPIKPYDGISEPEFQEVVDKNPLTIFYIFKEEGD
ncbi:unnamed protein product, partial [marine sediment metagenome]